LSVRSEVEERQQIEVEEESLIEAVRRATTLSAVCSARRKWCSPIAIALLRPLVSNRFIDPVVLLDRA